jgi:hypothetical protein
MLCILIYSCALNSFANSHINILQSRPGAAALYMKPFVTYDKLCEIYASDLGKGAKAKGRGDPFELHEEHSSADMTEATHQSENDVDSHCQQPCHGSNPSNGSKSTCSRKRVFLDDDVFASEFSNAAKSIKTLVDAETTNAAAMNALQVAYAKELEAQKQTADRREQLFNELAKYNEFRRDQIVKAALIIGQDEAKLNIFFTTPEQFKSEFIRQVLQSVK